MSIKIQTLQDRRQKIISLMADDSIAIILGGKAFARTGDQFHEFVVWRNFFYLTNIDRENFAIVLVKSSSGNRELLFIDEVSEFEEKWSGKRMRKNEASDISGIEEKSIYGMFDMHKVLGSIILNEQIKNAYFDLERITYSHLDTQQITFSKEIMGKYPYLTIHSLYADIAKMRQVKSDCEIKNIEIAIEKTKVGIEAMMKASTPGLYEYEIEAHYDFNAKLGGVKEKAFHTIAAAGANATVLHYESNDSQALDGDLILFDLGCAWNHYSADISRTFPVNGKFTPRQKDVYQAVLDVEKAVIEAVKPGITMSDLNELARNLLITKSRNLGLITEDDEIINYYYHSIGHSLGLDTHDVGTRDFELEPGMVVTIEPGLYIENESIGVRIEDDILVTKTGHKNLSAAIIKEIDDIEAFMKK